MFHPGMDEIINIGNVGVSFYHISFCKQYIVMEHCSIKKNLPFQVSKVDIGQLIQFHTIFQRYIFEISQNNTMKYVNSCFATIYSQMYNMKVILL
jgi:hypothetical protein